jgi:type II secretory pathway pseudopilin PulG
MTLVELLVTILIIGILTSLVLGVAALAGETAREAKTRMMVSRLHTLLMEQYDTYKNRRIDTSILDNAIRTATGRDPTPNERADNRLLALRQLMKMEMPDRWSDLLNDTVDNLRPNDSQADFDDLKNNARTGREFYYLPARTELWSAYLRRYRQLARTNTITGDLNTPEDIRANQGAECLYLIITLATGDGEARSLFHEDDIGDTDGDGAPEFLDGWGHPIEFLRWAPGFSSEAQLGPVRLEQVRADAITHGMNETQADQEVTNAVAADHDPFDMYRRDTDDASVSPTNTVYDHLRDNRYSYRLVPLIYSAGRDEIADINVDPTDFANSTWVSEYGWIDPYAPAPNGLLLGTPITLEADGTVSPSTPRRVPPISLPAMDPADSNPVSFEVGADANGATDNIHNHLIGTR